MRRWVTLAAVQLADRIGYSATVVAHAELGRRPVSAEFRVLADEALGAGGNQTAGGIRIRELTRARREEQRRLDKAWHARLARFLPQSGAGGTAVAVPADTGTGLRA